MIVLYGDCLDCKYVKFAGGLGLCDREECPFKPKEDDNGIISDKTSAKAKND